MTYHYPKTPFSIKDLDLDKVLGICTPGNPRPKLVTHLPPPRSTQLFIKGPIPFPGLKKLMLSVAALELLRLRFGFMLAYTAAGASE